MQIELEWLACTTNRMGTQGIVIEQCVNRRYPDSACCILRYACYVRAVPAVQGHPFEDGAIKVKQTVFRADP